jgi:hypothetical protein
VAEPGASFPEVSVAEPDVAGAAPEGGVAVAAAVAATGAGAERDTGGRGRGDEHPPVAIGEIHVHVSEPAGARAADPTGSDPLALLAPYAQGLTARRDGVR